MRKLFRPVLFSQKFGVSPALLKKARLLDPILNSDTLLFIDPLLIPRSKNATIRKDGPALMRAGFKKVLELVDVSEAEGDVAWKAAFRALNLDERPETGLGYGGASRSGADRPEELRQSILRTAKQVVTLGVKNPSVVPSMSLFERGVGPDTISDMTTNLILPALYEITSEFCEKHAVSTVKWSGRFQGYRLPKNPLRPNEPVLLVPRDIVRHLPLAADWASVPRVIMEAEEVREAVNRMVGNWAKATVSEKKVAIRRAALEDVEILKKILQALVGASESYDEEKDLDGLYTFREILASNSARYKGTVARPTTKSLSSLRSVVLQIVQQFRDMVEHNNLWELLWHGDEPRHERAAQLLFFSVANVICAANDIDISPETNSGGGPVDFKFSNGYSGRVVVEIKLSTGRVEHGYEKQLEVYKKASQNAAGVMLVVDVGNLKTKLKKIRAAKLEAEKAGVVASEIEYVDARPKRSASRS